MAGPVIDVSDATFARDVIEASQQQPVIVDFWAAWCGPCRALGPMLEEVVAAHEGVVLAKLDVDSNPRTSMQFGIRGIPAVKAFRDGRVVDEFVGLQPRRNVERFVESLVPQPAVELPSDEAGLRSLLEEQPGNIEARRTLGRLLIAAGRIDEADSVLTPALPDAVSDGLRARIELMREGLAPQTLDHGAPVDELAAAEQMIHALPSAESDVRNRLRRVVVGILEDHADAPAASELRRHLASALF